MPARSEHPPFDLARIVETLARHGVEYLLVGGVGAAAHGALQPTFDFDCLAKRTFENLTRLGAAMRELNARLRAEGVDDEVAKALPVQLGPEFLAAIELSTWRTDAGDFDVLADMPNRTGGKVRYEELRSRAVTRGVGSVQVVVAGLDDIIASKEWANRPKDLAALPELRALSSKQHRT